MYGYSTYGQASYGGSQAATNTTPTPQPSDTTAPSLNGPIQVSSVTTTTAHAYWPAASDDTGVAGYEFSCDTGIAQWIDVGNVISADPQGLTPSTNYTARYRAYDAAGNRSPAVTYAFQTNAVPVDPPSSGYIDATKVPAARIVVFSGGVRVVNFEGSKRTVSF